MAVSKAFISIGRKAEMHKLLSALSTSGVAFQRYDGSHRWLEIEMASTKQGGRPLYRLNYVLIDDYSSDATTSVLSDMAYIIQSLGHRSGQLT